jgi:hypothetical protein
MKRVLAILLIGVSPLFTLAADTTSAPSISLEPFEPVDVAFYNSADKFSHPPEVVPLRFIYPLKERHGVDGEATILVRIDRNGLPIKLTVLSCSMPVFSEAAVKVLSGGKWKVESRPSGEKQGLLFYYKVRYSLVGE